MAGSGGEESCGDRDGRHLIGAVHPSRAARFAGRSGSLFGSTVNDQLLIRGSNQNTAALVLGPGRPCTKGCPGLEATVRAVAVSIVQGLSLNSQLAGTAQATSSVDGFVVDCVSGVGRHGWYGLNGVLLGVFGFEIVRRMTKDQVAPNRCTVL